MLIIYNLSLFDIMLCNCWLGKYSKMKISNFCGYRHEMLFHNRPVKAAMGSVIVNGGVRLSGGKSLVIPNL